MKRKFNDIFFWERRSIGTYFLMIFLINQFDQMIFDISTQTDWDKVIGIKLQDIDIN